MALGIRLWRGPDMGSKFDTEKDKGKVHKVFLTFSASVNYMIEDKEIIVDDRYWTGAKNLSINKNSKLPQQHNTSAPAFVIPSLPVHTDST